MLETLAGTAQAIDTAYSLAEKYGWVDRFVELFSRSQKVVLLGTSGVGKSSFVNSIQDLNAEIISSLNRTKISRTHKLKIGGDRFHFVDTPGHVGYKKDRHDAILDALKYDDSIFLHVCCGGFFENDRPIEEYFRLDAIGQKSLLGSNLLLEIEHLREWVGLLGGGTKSQRLITVVSKGDLWGNDRIEITAHYERGPYAQALEHISGLNASVVPYCSVIKRFFDRGPVSEEFDEALKRELRKGLIEQLFAAGRA